MRFFEAQKFARQKTFYLLILFAINVTVLSVLNSLFIGLLLRVRFREPLAAGFFEQLRGPRELLIFWLSVAIFFLVGLYFRKTALSPSALATALGGRLLVSPKNKAETVLKNVVEEMAIASGVPVPQIFILEYDRGINAFAAGKNDEPVVIGVTRGAVELLNRDELQGIIGHEFSHILNEDISLNLTLSGVVGAFQIFYKMGQGILKSSGRSSGGRGQDDSRYIGSNSNSDQVLGFAVGGIIGFVLIVLGSIGYLLARILQSFISREREFLADASSAQFTRNPEGLARALGKILLGAGSQIDSIEKMQVAHIFFAEGLSKSQAFLFSTHPDLRERIIKLVPEIELEDFLGDLQKEMLSDPVVIENAGATLNRVLIRAATLEMAKQSAGRMDSTNHSLSQVMRDQIDHVISYLSDEKIARAVLALLLYRSQSNYEEAAEILKNEFPTTEIFLKFRNIVEAPAKQSRVTLFHCVLRTLSHLSIVEKRNLIESVKKVIDVDAKMDLLEGLFLLNVQLTLTPAQSMAWPTADEGEVLQKVISLSSKPDQVDFGVLTSFVAVYRNQPMAKKRSVAEEIGRAYGEAPTPCLEEFRLLCLSIGVSTPVG